MLYVKQRNGGAPAVSHITKGRPTSMWRSTSPGGLFDLYQSQNFFLFSAVVFWNSSPSGTLFGLNG